MDPGRRIEIGRSGRLVVVNREVVSKNATGTSSAQHLRRGYLLEDIVFDQYVAASGGLHSITLTYGIQGAVKVAITNGDRPAIQNPNVAAIGINRANSLHQTPGAIEYGHSGIVIGAGVIE